MTGRDEVGMGSSQKSKCKVGMGCRAGTLEAPEIDFILREEKAGLCNGSQGWRNVLISEEQHHGEM